MTVGVENDDATRSVMVSVQDTGLGIPPEAVEKVFESSTESTVTSGRQGHRPRAEPREEHRRDAPRRQVGLSSQVGLGSRFWFTIPYERKGRAATTTRAAA